VYIVSYIELGLKMNASDELCWFFNCF